MSSRARGESGAVAILTALVAVVLMSIAALAIDLGNAMVHKRDTQSQADFSALAGAGGTDPNLTNAGLPAASTTTSATDDSIVAAANYLYRNQPQNDSSAPRRTATQLAADLVDHDRSNGEAYYGDFGDPGAISALDNSWTGVLALHPNVNELTILTPPALVKFGFAKVMGFSSTSLQSAATAAVGSPAATSIMPMFAVPGCDYGPQTLTEPANGQQVKPTPVLDYPLATANGNQATISAITLPVVVAPNSLPRIEISDPSGAQFQISGSHLPSTTWVGFFHDTSIYPDVPTHLAYALNSTNFPGFNANNGNGQLSFPISSIPAAVRGTPGAWYIRLSSSAPVAPATEPAQWSSLSTAKPFQVGDFTFRCSGASNSGNFGTLKLPRTDVGPSSWIPKNISDGLQRPLTLAKRPGSSLASGPNLCVPGAGAPVVYSTSSTLLPKTNCVDTDPGLTTNTTTAGLVATNGRLVKNGGKTSQAPYDAGTCAPDGLSSSTTLTTSGHTYGPLNNDLLTCFMSNLTMPLSTIASASYAGPPVLSEAIYSSPRFFWVPVFGTPPGNGASGHYTVLGMRPAFLTDQPLGATRQNRTACSAPGGSCFTYNGLGISNSGVSRLTVFFINEKALPNLAGNAPTADYFGTGPKVAVMTN
ncbi:MAG: Tad domain-containing protein [Marmoricola sp.]